MDIQGVSVAENTVRWSVCANARPSWPRHLLAVINTDATPCFLVDPIIIVMGTTEAMESEMRSISERNVEVSESSSTTPTVGRRCTGQE